jgi:hypothetical protein
MAVSRIQSQAEAREQADREEALKKRAARQAAQTLAAPETIPTVTCRVLPLGDGRISMGEHVRGIGDAYYEKGETFSVEKPIADQLEARGFIEIQD